MTLNSLIKPPIICNEFLFSSLLIIYQLKRILNFFFFGLKHHLFYFFRWGTRWHQIQDSISMWRSRFANILWSWWNHSSHTCKLWQIFHCHLQQKWIHRLECELYVSHNYQNTTEKVSTTTNPFCRNYFGSKNFMY